MYSGGSSKSEVFSRLDAAISRAKGLSSVNPGFLWSASPWEAEVLAIVKYMRLLIKVRQKTGCHVKKQSALPPTHFQKTLSIPLQY